MKGSNRFYFLLGILVVFVAIEPAFACHRGQGTLRGTVRDSGGAVLADATVTVTNPSRGITKTAKTGADGSYQVQALPPGTYQVTFERLGFAKRIAKEEQVRAGKILISDAQMRRTTLEVIEVTGDEVPPLIDQTPRLVYIDNR